MEFILEKLISSLMVVGPFFILLGVLIFVHELGHFLVARFYGVRVETFSLGFGKKIFKYKHGDTIYCISMIPLGGYVKMFGDDPSKEVAAAERKYSFLHQPIFPRMAIVAAGPLINFFFAILVFTIVALVGESVPNNRVGDVDEGSYAQQAGFRSGDRIIKINDEEIRTWSRVKALIESNPGQNLSVIVEREDGGAQDTLVVRPTLGENENVLSPEDRVGRVEGLSTSAQSTIVAVTDNESPAYRGGLRSLQVIEKINGEEVHYFRELPVLLKKHGPNYEFEVSHYQDEETGKKTIVQLQWPQFNKNEKNILAAFGVGSPELVLGRVKKESPAERAGFQMGDRLVRVDGKPIQKWEEVLESVKGFDSAKQGIEFEIIRDGQVIKSLVRPEMDNLMNPRGQEEKRFTVGIVPAFVHVGGGSVLEKANGFGGALAKGVQESITWTQWTLMSFVRLIENKVSHKNIGGVLTIGRVAAQSFEVGISAFLKMMGIISINLFILNLLPVPVLDGGHLLFFSIEALRGAPLSLRKMEIAQTVGLVLLMSLMVFAFYNDINNWLSSAAW